jgi:hypothetical protein
VRVLAARLLGRFLTSREQRWFLTLEKSPQNAYRYKGWTIRLSLLEREFVDGDPPHALLGVGVWNAENHVADLDVLARVSIAGRVLRLTDAHIGSDHGTFVGKLQRERLNALGNALKESAHVDTIIVEGGVRNTGTNSGRAPKPFRF